MFIVIDLKKMIYPAIIVILLLIIFIQRSCCGESSKFQTKKEILIPEKKDSFPSIKPIKLVDIKIKDSIVFKDRKINVVNPLDKKMVVDYLKAKDSIERLNLFIKAVKINKYNQNFDNDDISLNIEAETTGTLNYVKPIYTIKAKKVSAPVYIKQTKFALYTGIQVYNNKNLGNAGIEVDLSIQNKKGDMYTIGYDTDKNIYIGYKFRLININK